jgi:hypothetical protein
VKNAAYSASEEDVWRTSLSGRALIEFSGMLAKLT